MELSFFARLIGHFKTITTHKLLVGKYCFKCGLYRQGILHDCSKYSWVEFSSGVKYYQGNRSPIDKEKEILGYSGNRNISGSVNFRVEFRGQVIIQFRGLYELAYIQ